VKLYSMALSGNSYKARLGLALMGRDYELVELDWRKGETRTAEFLRINPRGQVPVLQDGDLIVWDSQAILVYLARLYDPKWLPMETLQLTEVMQWLAVSENEISRGLATVRGAKRYVMEVDMVEGMRWSLRALTVLEQRLGGLDWVAAGQPTIADIACFPYVALCEQGGFDLNDYPSIGKWIRRVKSLDSFVGMEGVEPLG
jgi:glutathione S-transferase